MVMSIGFGDLGLCRLQGLRITWGLLINVVSMDPLRPPLNPNSETLNPKYGSMLGILYTSWGMGLLIFMQKGSVFL